MTEYIATEDDNVMTHFLQVFVIGLEDCSTLFLAIQMDECLVIHMTHWNCILKVWIIIASYQDLFR